MTDAVIDPVAPATPDQTETPAAEESVASHAAQFSPEAREQAAETADDDVLIVEAPSTPQNQPQPRERHRAQSQKARAGDVPRIQELTKNWRTEQERVKQLEARLAELEKSTKPAPLKQETGGFAEKEPTLEDFANEEDPYTEWVLAKGEWRGKKRAWEEQQAKAAEQAKTEDVAAQERRVQALSQHKARVAEYVKANPEFQKRLAAVADRPVPELLQEAIIGLDNGPAVLDALVTDPAFLDEMHLISEGRAVTDTNVAILRRRLTAQLTRGQAGTTGSAAANSPVSQAPRPPNPVRTGPMKSGDEPPGEGHSIDEHRKFYTPKR